MEAVGGCTSCDDLGSVAFSFSSGMTWVSARESTKLGELYLVPREPLNGREVLDTQSDFFSLYKYHKGVFDLRL